MSHLPHKTADTTLMPTETLEAIIARLVTDALRVCGGSVEGCQIVQERSDVTTPVERPEVLLSGVVSLRVLEALAKPTPKIVIDPKAILTPSARDWLRQHEIAAVAQNARPMVTVIDTQDLRRAEAVGRQLGLRGLPADVSSVSNLGQKINSVEIVISELPAIEVDQLSHQHSLHAVAVDSLELAKRILPRMRPDVWVLDSTRLQISGLVSVAEFCIRGSLAQHPLGKQIAGKQTGGLR